jgi:uncharacterized protein (TIGR01370 family)
MAFCLKDHLVPRKVMLLAGLLAPTLQASALADSEPVVEAVAAPQRLRWSHGPLRVGYVLRPGTLEPERSDFVDLVRSTDRNLWILDVAYDRDQPSRWTYAEIDAMRATDPSRKVLAMLSITSVDPGRDYYEDVAGGPLVVGPSPTERGALRVRWWDPAWQEMVLGTLDAVLARGFDGVVLGGVDAFAEGELRGDTFRPGAINPATKRSYRADMAAWVKQVAAYGRAGGQGSFLVFAQGGVELLGLPGYGDTLDGMLAEGLFAENGARAAWVERYLDPFAVSGGTVVLVESQQDGVARDRAATAASARGFSVLFNSSDRTNLGVVR